MLTFRRPPTIGKTGQIRVYDTATGNVVDILDLSIRPGPPPRSARGGSSPAAPQAIYQKDVIGRFTEGFHFYLIIAHDHVATITLQRIDILEWAWM